MEKYVFMLEQDHDDLEITRTFLKEANKDVDIEYIQSVDEMFRLLEKGRLPSIILIDYNLMPVSAVQVMRQLKAHEVYRSIPIVILSDNAQPEFIKESYANGACSFIQKPASVEDTRNKLYYFFHYWTQVSETISS